MVLLIEKHTVYVADDDKNVCEILKSQLQKDNYFVEVFYSGEALLSRFNSEKSDLIITDIMMPNMSGYDLCREIRKKSDVPIIMLSAKGEEIDRVLGLELGSDDYISKPFSLREISVKVRNILRRRFNKVLNNTNDEISCKDLQINEKERWIKINDHELKTTKKEFDLLLLLVKNKNIAFSREKIIEMIWGYDYMGDTRQVDHIIKRLRKKLLLIESEFNIQTIWGYGYKVSDYE